MRKIGKLVEGKYVIDGILQMGEPNFSGIEMGAFI
jgi:hypothetical protein